MNFIHDVVGTKQFDKTTIHENNKTGMFTLTNLAPTLTRKIVKNRNFSSGTRAKLD